MTLEKTNIQRALKYKDVSWGKFQTDRFASETEPFPYGIHKLRGSDQRRIHKPVNFEKKSFLVGYGPIVVSVLEDDAPLLLSFLSTLNYFFKSKEQSAKQKDFLPGSPVYAVWATCPEDLEKVHQSLVRDLNNQGYKNENINFLNIFDNQTNHRRNKNEPEIGQEIIARKSGGREALEYIHQYIQSSPTSATLVQTHNTDNDTRQKYQNSLDELTVETGNDSQYKIHSVAEDNTILLPLAWHKKDSNFIANFLNGLWNEKKIPFFGKLISLDAAEDSNSINKSLLQVIEAFRIFVKDKTPTTKYNEIIPTKKANSAAA